jgi:primosomal protein N' (replication factor Y)
MATGSENKPTDYTDFVEVAIPSSSPQTLTYGWDLTDHASPQSGLFVQIDVRGRPKVGVILCSVPRPKYECKPVIAVLWGAPVVPQPLMTLLHWVAQYYLCHVPRLIHLAAPGKVWKAAAATKRDNRLNKHFSKATKPSAATGSVTTPAVTGIRLRGERDAPEDLQMMLSVAQQEAIASITKNLLSTAASTPTGTASTFRTVLLEGVTGSGKTEVYLSAARSVINSGKNVLVLVPEIALTPQMTARFRAHFGDELAVLHSGLTDGETEREWYRIALGSARVVLGVRRGIFVPLRDVGLIIVDEEHDASYKSDEYPAVHARDVAIKRAQIEGAVCVLGSASPSIETHANAKRGVYEHIILPARAKGKPPQIEVIDSKLFFASHQSKNRLRPLKQGSDRSSGFHFSGPIIVPQVTAEIARCKERGEQSMVIVNRRGYAHFAICLDCGHAKVCPHCEATTTLHKGGAMEICHHCGFKTPRRPVCGNCGSDSLETRGFGTQRVQEELAAVLPHLEVARLDRDVMTSPTRLSDLLDGFRKGQFDTLIGTQILSKGHDFPRVSLVAVLHLEDALFLPDFRSGERTFQLLLQSAGRAGRGDVPGRVLVQSLQPSHPVLAAVVSGQHRRFYETELEMRRLSGLPPFARQVLFGLENPDENALSRDALHFADAIRAGTEGNPAANGMRIIGPFPAPLERLGGRYRAQLVISVPRSTTPRQFVPSALLGERFGTSKLRIDVDPHDFM